MDPEVLTANGQLLHHEFCRSIVRASRLAVHDSFHSTPNCSRQQNSSRSLSFEWESKAVSNFCFQNLVAKNVRLVAMMRLVFGIGAKLRLLQIFWSQNLTFQSQKCDYAPGFFEPAVRQNMSVLGLQSSYKARSFADQSLFLLVSSLTLRWCF